MTFAGPSMEPPDDYSCTRCEDDDAMDHDDCNEAAQDAYDDALMARDDADRGR